MLPQVRNIHCQCETVSMNNVPELSQTILKQASFQSSGVSREQWFSTWGRVPRGAVNHFGVSGTRHFMYTTLLHLLCSSFAWG